MSAVNDRVRLRFPPEAEYLAICRLALGAVCRGEGFDEETTSDLKLAVTEACANAVRHAYGPGEDGEVEMVLDIHPDRIVCEVIDRGRGFDPDAPPPPAEGEGGLGLSIIRSVTDELAIEPADPGIRLRFVKHRATPDAASLGG
jgi:serine/threonine-protein kinase RsbW